MAASAASAAAWFLAARFSALLGVGIAFALVAGVSLVLADGTVGCLISGSFAATGCADVVAGEFDTLVLACAGLAMATGWAPGGGGNGEIPILSDAAAAAAADAYLRPSAGLAGTDAGFMTGPLELPLLIVANGVCSVASAGKGDLDCALDLRPDADTSATAFGFALGGLMISGSGVGSSACDWASCDDPLSPS